MDQKFNEIIQQIVLWSEYHTISRDKTKGYQARASAGKLGVVTHEAIISDLTTLIYNADLDGQLFNEDQVCKKVICEFSTSFKYTPTLIEITAGFFDLNYQTLFTLIFSFTPTFGKNNQLTIKVKDDYDNLVDHNLLLEKFINKREE